MEIGEHAGGSALKAKLLGVVSILIPATIVLAGTNWMGVNRQVGLAIHSQAITIPNYGTTLRVSIASDGSQGNDTSYFPSISANGRFVVFDSFASSLVSRDVNGKLDVFVRDKQTGITQRVSIASDGRQGNNHSWSGSISANGRYVAYWSFANNLVLGDDNGVADVFLYNREWRNILSHLPVIHFQPK